MTIPIYRNGIEISSFKADESTIYSYQLMGEHKITANITTREPLPIQIGDYITYNGQNFYLNTVPPAQATDLLVYNLTFEAIIYRLYDKILLDEGNMNFTYYGDAQLYIELVVNNINEIDSGWTVGTVETTAPKHIPFEGKTTCREALTKIAQEFGLEYYLVGKQINLVKQAGNTTSLTFKYGRQEGLYSLSRNYIDEKNIVTKVYGFGSDKNLPEGYRNGAKQLIFNEKFLTLNTDLYGIKEGVYEDTEVFPHRDGTVTTASAYTEGQTTFTVTDTSLDFDINDYLLPGAVAKIVFKTGELSGYEFEITKYDHATKTITFKLYTDGTNYTIPNSTFSAAVGDTYTLVDIFMPQSYLDAAEAELKARTLEYLQENAVPRVAYSLEIDPLHIKSQNIILAPGDKVTVVDSRLGINTQIRVNSVSYPVGLYTDPLVNGKSFFKAEIADFVTYTIQERLIADTRDTKKEIKIVDRTNAERARRTSANLRQLQELAFDPDGYFNSDKIKPSSIETYMLAVGAKSQNFSLNGVVLTPNYNGNPNSISISSGQLIHREIEISLGYTWELTAGLFNSLDPVKPYYIYARCSKTSLVGTWVVSQEQIQVEQETGFYHFSVGILYKVNNGYRDHDFTYGLTSIVGENIKTGKISSVDGGTYIDLNGGQSRIRGQMIFSNGVDAETAIDNLNTAIDTTNNYVDTVTADLQNQIDGQIMSWFYDYDPTLANVPASNWVDTPEKERHLGDLFYNNLTGKAFRFSKNGSDYQWFLITDTDVTLALATANAAKDTADQKRRVFSDQPYTPYDVGDLWAPGTSGYTQKCVVARASGVFNASDWVKADKATDDTAVDNLQIGGRNLVPDSSFELGRVNLYGYNDITNAGFITSGNTPIGYATTPFGKKLLFIDGNGGDMYVYFGNANFTLRPGTLYTVSFWYKMDSNDGGAVINCYLRGADGSHYRIDDAQGITYDWTRVTKYFTCPQGITDFSLRFGIYASAYTWLQVDAIQIEEGNKATSWKPAIEDADYIDGTGMWIFSRYNITTAAGTVPTPALINGLSPDDRYLVWDSTSLINGIADNYVGHLKTAVYVSQAKTISYTFGHEDGCSVYVNGMQIYAYGTNRDNNNISLTLKQGWNTVEYFWAEQSGGDGIYNISTSLGQLVDKVSCYYADDKSYVNLLSNKTNFLGTTINEHGVATGVLGVGDSGGGNAGISGVTDNGDSSVRYWSGAPYENKNSAPFRVLHNGKAYLTDAYVRGEINATSGTIGTINITSTGYMSAGDPASGDFMSIDPGSILLRHTDTYYGGRIEFAHGYKGLGYYSGGYFEDSIADPIGTNVALQLKASGGASNYAIDIISGDIRATGTFMGLAPKAVRVSSGYSITNDDFLVNYVPNSDGTIYLPANPVLGKIVVITHQYGITLTVSFSGKQGLYNGALSSGSFECDWREWWQWDGVYWNRLN